MIIKHGCAILRSIEEKDFDLLYFMINDSEIEYLSGGWSYPVSKEQQKDYMRTFRNDDKHIKLMIELTNGKTIGMVTAENIDWKNRKAVYGMKTCADANSRMKGDTFDAGIGFLDYLFNELGMNCVYGTILEENIFSRKLVHKLRFHEDGVLRQQIFKKGKYHNLIAVSILRDEFNSAFSVGE